MKNTILLSLILALTSCNSNNGVQDAATENFDWLLGDWKRTNEEDGKETYERWHQKDGSEYKGIGFTLQNGDTISKEEMSLLLQDNKWSFVVKTAKDKEPITFNITEIKSNSFVSINDSVDFPREIKYWMDGNKLKAQVSNDFIMLPFDFETIK